MLTRRRLLLVRGEAGSSAGPASRFGGVGILRFFAIGMSLTACAGQEAQDPVGQAFAAYADCMRSEGISLADPEVDESGRRTVGGREGFPADVYDKADAECKRFIDAVLTRPTDRNGTGNGSDARGSMLACLRARGIDVPDADDPIATASTVNATDAELQGAVRTCEQEVYADDHAHHHDDSEEG